MGDPRYAQILCLTLLLVYGRIFLDFSVSVPHLLILLGSGLALQWMFTRLFRLPVLDPKSVLISCLSLGLLLRTDSYDLLFLSVLVAVAGKFLIRCNHKHLFNPTNLGIVVVVLVSDSAWVSPGQWGQTVLFAFTACCMGVWVIYRTRRSDISMAFLVFYSMGLLARAAWLDDPVSIPVHQMQNGALLIFAFFMISDPKTLPDSRTGRVLFALMVAVTAIVFQYYFYLVNGLLYALAMCAPLVPLIDRLLPAPCYEWHSSGADNAGCKLKQSGESLC